MSIIKKLRQQKGLSQIELAKICGVHQTAISQWEKGRTSPDKSSLAELSRFFGVSIDYLLGGNKESGRNLVPVLGFVRAGIPLEAVEEILDYEEITHEMASGGEHFALAIKGDSMAPRFQENDVVVVKKQEDVDSGDIAVVLINGMDATVKKLIKKEKGITLLPLNPSYEAMFFTPDEIESMPISIIGKVVELRGKF